MKKIIFNHEHVDHYDGQDNYELGIYEDDDENPIGFSSETIIGYVAYTVYNNEITVSDIIIRPNRRREGFGSMLIKKMKSLHPDAVYRPSLKTDLGSKFIHKDVDIMEERNKIKTLMNILMKM
jgi:hypothetical protein